MTQTLLFLHIGLEKTGTTAIQVFLRDNRELLFSRHGIFDGSSDSAIDSIRLHHQIAKYFLDRPLAPHIPKLSEAEFTEWVAHLAAGNYKTAIVSSELFSYLRDEQMSELVNRLQINFDLKAIIYLRRQDLYLDAQYQQHLKGVHQTGGTPIDADLFTVDTLDYLEFCCRWARQLGEGNIIVVPYPLHAPHEFIFETMLGALSVSRRELKKMRIPRHTVNPRLLPFHARLLQNLHFHIHDSRLRSIVASWLVAHSELIAEQLPAYRRTQMISCACRGEILSSWRQTNETLAKQYRINIDCWRGQLEEIGEIECQTTNENATILNLLEYIAGLHL